MEIITIKMLPNTSHPPERFEHRLAAHPELRAKFEVLLSIVENTQGDLIAEQRVIEEIRQLGQIPFLTSFSTLCCKL
jgi:hypothetical protein